MAASLRNVCALIGCVTLLASCAKGSCDAQATAQIWAPDCGLEGEQIELGPNFCAMQPSASVEIIDIVVQRGSDLKSYSDGISVFIDDPEMVKESMLGTEIELGGFGPEVSLTLYMNETCPGVARIPVVYTAVSGTIRFDELFVPWSDNTTEETRAVFTNVELNDRQDTEERRAVLDGEFSFFFERGMPAQFFGF